MQKNCKKCSQTFQITSSDLEFYKKISPKFDWKIYEIPAPTFCPDCRQQRRLSFRNERKLYRRDCDATWKQIISIYSPDKNLKVYDSKIWWWDSWDGIDYWKDFDFNKSFFKQFYELNIEVPKVGIINKNSEGSDYTHLCTNNRNCYLLIESSDNEKCMYSYWIQKCNYCLDSSFSSNCEVCYNIDNCFDCYKLFNSKDCNSSSNSNYLNNCKNCEFCFNCTDLDWKKYFINNIEFSKEEYLLLSTTFFQKWYFFWKKVKKSIFSSRQIKKNIYNKA